MPSHEEAIIPHKTPYYGLWLFRIQLLTSMTEDTCLGTFCHWSLSLLVFREVLPHTATIKLTRVSRTPQPHTESVEVIGDVLRMSEGVIVLVWVAEWS